MEYYELVTNNLKADEAVRCRKAPDDITACNLELGYRGFVNCQAAENGGRFVMFTNADDFVAGSYFYRGPASFETGTLRLWTHLVKHATWVYDVGAFTGVFSLAAAATNPACYVMAFEPSFITYSRLLVNIRANQLDDRIAPLRFGLGDAALELELRHQGGVYVMASGESFVAGQVENPWLLEKVPVITLDALFSEQESFRRELVIQTSFAGVDLLKIDVEGFEENVLAGMQNIIRQYQPTAIVEILDPACVGTVLNLFGDGYEVWHINEDTGALSKTLVGTNKLFIHDDQVELLSDYALR